MDTNTGKWHLRPNTQDEDIYTEVYVDNCYQVPEDLTGITVIDIGANIGAFSRLCLEREAEKVIAIEPERDNYLGLVANTSGFPGRISTIRAAVIGQNEYVYIVKSRENETVRTGGYHVLSSSGASTISYNLNTVMNRVPETDRVWIKLDCEGAEYQILSSDLPWNRIERIFGEIHDCRDGKISRDTGEVKFAEGAFGSLDGRRNSLVKHLEEKGFEVATEQHPEDDRLSLFWAHNKAYYDMVDVSTHADGPVSKLLPVEKNPKIYNTHGSENSIANAIRYAEQLAMLREGKIKECQESILEDLEREWETKEASRTVAVLTPFRNARRYLQLYFKQLSALRDELRGEKYNLRLVASEGDSLDGTRERIQELSSEYNIPLTLVDTTHGHMKWASVEDPVRMKVMSDVMNKALNEVKPTDGIVVWIMSDLEWEPVNLTQMVIAAYERRDDFDIFSPLVFCPRVSDSGPDKFYDTWAFRGADGVRFQPEFPWHLSLSGDFDEVWSAGTCLVMKARVARDCRATDQEAVSFCENARTEGYRIAVTPLLQVYHTPAPTRYCLLWVSDAVCITGFSRVAHAMFPILAEAGFDLDIVAVNYWGMPHNFPYTIYPANVYGEDDSGNTRVRLLVQSAYEQGGKSYDAIIKLDDHWNISSLVAELDVLRDKNIDTPPVIAWVTVDGKNIKADSLAGTHIPCTDFGAGELKAAGVVPFGVDIKTFKPQDRAYSRSLVCHKDISPDAFVVGTVSTNQFRKRLDLTLSYFAEWVSQYNAPVGAAYLYLCVSGQHNDGIDIPSLIRYFGLKGRIILNTSLLPDEYLAHVYSSFDVFMSMSMGEGFGLPCLEALACGIPAIVPDWSGYGSWVPEEAAYKIPCSAVIPMSPLNAPSYIMGGVADRDETVGALQKLYLYPELRQKMGRAGVEFAHKMTWERTGRMLISEIERVMDMARDKAVSKQQEEELSQAREEAKIYCKSITADTEVGG